MKLKVFLRYLYDNVTVQLILIKGTSPYPAIILRASKVHVQYPNLLEYSIGNIYANSHILIIELIEPRKKK